ncbi:S8 family serine peptidase [Adlercreutzia mucosicola]|uniref:S8 family serine peptidase n=1 Tax=Adlercreutzia mucosicola TaxID=580026 RepID=UPI002B248C41|nr:S8 family serine peptidase [Adlercreutzia mucosicola]MEB1813650.1 S8 family serine peptidase [Adlercreutzia mucosicola]
MDQRSGARVQRVLCVALVALLALVGMPGVAIPQAAAASPASDGAARAAQERATDPEDLGYLPGEIVVIYDRDATEAQKDAAAQTVEGDNSAPQAEFDMGTVTTVEISDDLTVQEATAIIEDDPAVQCAMPNYVAALFDDPAPATATASDDKYRREQWYLDYVKVPEAWEALANRPSAARTKVAVIDTGASLTHPDLRRIVNKPESIEVRHPDNPTSADDWWEAPLRGDGYTNGSAAINEFSSHGTHVSGIVAAEAGNGGVEGVASAAGTLHQNKLVDLVVIDAFSLLRQQSDGTYVANAVFEDLIFALEYARDHGCTVVNMSLGFTVTDQRLTRTFEQLTTELTRKNNMLIVAAAGNEGANKPTIPARCSNVIGVTSVSDLSVPYTSEKTRALAQQTWTVGTTTRSYFSNYGTWCDIAAPGEGVLSSVLVNGTRDDYNVMSGTSMACPVVTGVAALVRSANPQLSATQVRTVLLDTATNLGQPLYTGRGVVNAGAAVYRALATTGTAAPDPAPAPPAPPAGAWRHDGRGWWYQLSGGGYPAASWRLIDGAWYYFDGAGYMQTGWLNAGGTWYYLQGSGAMATGWQWIGGAWYYLYPDTGAMATGWNYIDGTWYYLTGSGAMATGWQRLGGTWYYLQDSGAMATGWQWVGGAWYYLHGSGAMATGWCLVDGAWYYLDGSGAMAANRWIGNYYVTGSGAMATNTWIGRYHVNEDGLWDQTW